MARRTQARRSKRAAPKQKRRGFLTRLLMQPVYLLRFVLRIVWSLTVRAAVMGAIIVGLAVVYFAATLPPADNLLDGRSRGSVTMLDRHGEIFAWRGEQFGGGITTGTVSRHLINAVLATEDKRFHRHFGISPRGIASAIFINLREGRGPLSGHGGSTITQQTAKLLCLGVPFDPGEWESETAYEADCRQSSLWRKTKEAVYALAMEAKYSKDEILTVYLNRAFLGSGSRGFEAASRRYFDKPASEINASEAAMLAGLLVAPTRYAPTNSLKRSQERANLVLGLMGAQGYLTPEEEARAKANPATLSQAAQARAGGYFADWIMGTGPEFLTRDTTEDVIIHTTFDPEIQKAAEEAMRTVFATKVREGSEAQSAIVVMDADGAVRAMVGGRRTRVTGAFNRATQATRQTGSAFKPFVYAAALDLGLSPYDPVDDTPLTIDIPGSGPWTPKNYDDEFKGSVSLTEALSWSLNIPAVRVTERIGRENVARVATDFGIGDNLAEGPALALGASESTLLDMTGAYAGILNGGSSVEPYGVTELRLLGDSEPLMGQAGGLGERVITDKSARELIWMMTNVVEYGTGSRARIDGWPTAGKTGTTSAAKDAWFIGFTADHVAGVWMGYDDNTPLTGVTGGGLPAEIWRETMTRTVAARPPAPLPMSVPEHPAAAPQWPWNTAPPAASAGQGGGRPSGGTILDLLNGIFGRR